MQSHFNAGAAQTDITPPLGTLINGDFVTHYAKYIHDKLYAKAIVLQNENAVIAFVVVDICAMRKGFLDNVKLQIARETNISPSNILISSTHTHYGGSVEDLLLGAADLTYTLKLPALITDAVKRAWESIRPAKIAYGAVDVPEHVVGRRFFMKKEYNAAHNPVTGGLDIVKTNPFGYEHMIDKRASVVDTGLNYIAIQGLDNSWIGLLANYSMHYVGDCRIGTITADYFGQFARHISAKLSADANFVSILSNGASGEATIWDFVQPNRYPSGDFEKSRVIGVDLAEKLFESLKDVQWETEPALAALYEEVSVGTRKPSLSEVEVARSVVSETDYERLDVLDGLKPNDEGLRRIYAREQVLLNEYPDNILFPIQAIRIGASVIGALGGEFFAETGLWLKNNPHVKQYFTICLANDCVGYVPPAHELELGGYETWRCRTSFMEAGAETAIRSKLLSLITKL